MNADPSHSAATKSSNAITLYRTAGVLRNSSSSSLSEGATVLRLDIMLVVDDGKFLKVARNLSALDVVVVVFVVFYALQESIAI